MIKFKEYIAEKVTRDAEISSLRIQKAKETNT